MAAVLKFDTVQVNQIVDQKVGHAKRLSHSYPKRLAGEFINCGRSLDQLCKVHNLSTSVILGN
jgi:hypothetical protein